MLNSIESEFVIFKGGIQVATDRKKVLTDILLF